MKFLYGCASIVAALVLASDMFHAEAVNRTFATVQVKLASREQMCAESQARAMESRKFLERVQTHYSLLLQAANEMHAPLVMQKIVEMLIELEAKAYSETRQEQREYDRFMCWCEWTLTNLDEGIKVDTAAVSRLSEKILRAIANLAATKTEVEKLLKDIVINRREQKDATEQRAKEKNEFVVTEEEMIATIASVEQAIAVLQAVQPAASGAAFLQGSGMRQAHLLGVVGTIQRLLRHPHVSQRLSEDDMDTLQNFVHNPSAFSGQASRKGISALETGSSLNPFGEYAPQSTRIFGVLQSLLDGMKASLVDLRATEEKRIDAYGKYMIMKKDEEERLVNERALQLNKQAKYEKELAEAQKERSESDKRIVISKNMSEETDIICKEKARAWAERTQIRTGEMMSYRMAVSVLSGAKADKTFGQLNAVRSWNFQQLSPGERSAGENSFLQLEQRATHQQKQMNQHTYKRIMQLAKTYGSARLQSVAMQFMKKGGIFDDIIDMINAMVESLRKEGLEDVEHRDKCEVDTDANLRHNEQIGNEQRKLARLLASIDAELLENNGKKDVIIQDQIKAQHDKEELKRLREEEHNDYLVRQESTDKAVALLRQAAGIVKKFFEDNDMKLGIMEKKAIVRQVKLGLSVKKAILKAGTTPSCDANACDGMPNCDDGNPRRYIEGTGSCCSCPEEDCSAQTCSTDLCGDGQPRRPIGGDCCACPADGGVGGFNGNNRSFGLPPPTTFDRKGKESYDGMEGSGATMVIGLIQQTYKDLEMEMKMNTVYEKENQAEFEGQLQEYKETLANLREQLITVTAKISDLEDDKFQKEKRVDEVASEMKANLEMKKALESDCAWVEKAFGQRKEARAQEVEGLEAARRALAKHQIDEEDLRPGAASAL